MALCSRSLYHSHIRTSTKTIFLPISAGPEAENGSQALERKKEILAAGVVREGGWDAAEERDGGGGGV